jgi:hypothetical protein
MPTIAEIFGYYIRMFFDDHNPPHIHVYKKHDCVAILEINTGNPLQGDLKAKDKALLKGWVLDNKSYLMDTWNSYQLD